MNKIKNINKDTNLIIDNKVIKTIDINMKISKQINKNILKNNMKTNLNTDNISQIFSNSSLFEIKIQYLDSLKKLHKNPNDKTIINQDENDAGEEKENIDEYEKDSYYNRYKYNLSAFHIDNLKKLVNKNSLINNKHKSVDFNEKKKIEINNNFNLNKNNFLSIRKNISFLKKKEYEDLINKMRNIQFKNINRYDNIDNDKIDNDCNNIKEDCKKNKKYESILKENINDYIERQQKEYSLSKAIMNPNDHLDFLLYYYPRPGTKLLIKK